MASSPPVEGQRADASSGRAATIPLDVLAQHAKTLFAQGHLEAARQLGVEVTGRRPDDVNALLTLGHTLREMGRFDEAVTVLWRLLRMVPDEVGPKAALALTLFYKQDWARAWELFDVRFKMMERPPRVMFEGPGGVPVERPPWRGGALPSALLVLGEQGLGDTLQFVRFLPLVEAAGTRVICAVPQRMIRLLRTLGGNIEFRASEEAGPMPGIKAWTPLLNLPRGLGLGPESFAPKIPYLHADPDRVAQRRRQIGELGFKVGIVWQGNPNPSIDNGRSAPLAAFAPLAAIPGVRLISLQKGPGEEQIATVPFARQIENPGADFDLSSDGFFETAAIVACLDLVVSVDTSTVHLAGALGKPVLILLKRIASDWRWAWGRDDTDWYPTARLFKQRAPGDWTELLQRVAEEVHRRSEWKTAAGRARVPISAGEILDRLIRLECGHDAVAGEDAARERAALAALREHHRLCGPDIDRLFAELREVIERLSEAERDIRECERRGEFGPRFIALARAVIAANDRRAILMREIDRTVSGRG